VSARTAGRAWARCRRRCRAVRPTHGRSVACTRRSARPFRRCTRPGSHVRLHR
jgi:hypothetical protein